MKSRHHHWNTIHGSAYRHAGTMLRWASATPRARGALRYRCPVTGSFVLVTDDATLSRLSRRTARLRCADCGELHLVAVAADAPSVIVAAPDTP